MGIEHWHDLMTEIIHADAMSRLAESTRPACSLPLLNVGAICIASTQAPLSRLWVRRGMSIAERCPREALSLESPIGGRLKEGQMVMQ